MTPGNSDQPRTNRCRAGREGHADASHAHSSSPPPSCWWRRPYRDVRGVSGIPSASDGPGDAGSQRNGDRDTHRDSRTDAHPDPHPDPDRPGGAPRPPAGVPRHAARRARPAGEGRLGFTVFAQTGEATVLAQDSITVKSQDGFEKVYAISDTTRTLTGRRGNEVRQGDWVTVTATTVGERRRSPTSSICRDPTGTSGAATAGCPPSSGGRATPVAHSRHLPHPARPDAHGPPDAAHGNPDPHGPSDAAHGDPGTPDLPTPPTETPDPTVTPNPTETPEPTETPTRRPPGRPRSDARSGSTPLSSFPSSAFTTTAVRASPAAGRSRQDGGRSQVFPASLNLAEVTAWR